MTKQEEFKEKYNWSHHPDFNDDLQSVITTAISEHEDSKTVIKAKALRKRGTDEFYIYEDEFINGEWCTCELPNLLADTARMKSYENLAKRKLAADLPPDAELIDIEILIK